MELAIYISLILLIPATIAFLLVVVVQWYIIVTREPENVIRCDGGGRA